MTEHDDHEADGTDELDVAALQKQLEKLKRENYEFREERRRAAFVSKYGEQIADEVADLPEDKREAWAEKLLSLKTPSQEPEPTEPAPAEPPKVEEPAGLQHVVAAPAGGAPEGQTLTKEEFDVHVKDLGLAEAARRYGALVRFPNADNPLVTGQAPATQGSYRPPS